ncbi:MAG: formylglycine-generating enzyme family protein [Elusimicrobia bacterium]|nr:formylglycine-generating enzyme family protein [Elusimicrobiota bacterium]
MKKILIAAAMLGLTGAAYADDFTLPGVTAAGLKALAVEGPVAAAPSAGGYAAEQGGPVEFIRIPGGRFMMGTSDRYAGSEDASPRHVVYIETFEMSRTLVTVAQYAECVARHKCKAPATGGNCNWGAAGRELHPVNCVDWDQAQQYAGFKGARLPSESEWEYAAKSAGREGWLYPWGKEAPACDKAVMSGCRAEGTMPVCSRPAGNTKINGLAAGEQLCDMAGNVWQWVQDRYRNSYEGAPIDGGAVEGEGSARVMRGGSFFLDTALDLRADRRNIHNPDGRSYIGFRLAR